MPETGYKGGYGYSLPSHGTAYRRVLRTTRIRSTAAIFLAPGRRRLRRITIQNSGFRVLGSGFEVQGVFIMV